MLPLPLLRLWGREVARGDGALRWQLGNWAVWMAVRVGSGLWGGKGVRGGESRGSHSSAGQLSAQAVRSWEPHEWILHRNGGTQEPLPNGAGMT